MTTRVGYIAAVAGIAFGLGCGDDAPAAATMDAAGGGGGTGASAPDQAAGISGVDVQQTACASGQLCDGQCVDTMSNVLHCGACSVACPGGQSCVQGVCSCASGQELCGGSCVSTQTDVANCGACGNQCAVGATCEAGACTGGAAGTGGASGTGGEAGSGGDSAIGGDRATGGDSATGGDPAIGGDRATGGDSATGGDPASGGAPATGGDSATGGELATGGSSSGGDTGTGGAAGSDGFQHPGLLLTALDIERMRTMVEGQVEPYLSGWNRLGQEARAALDYEATPFQVVTRNTGAVGDGNTELRDDANAAFFHAVRWVVSGDEAHAEKSAEILNAWSSTLQAIEGDADRFLAAGLYGYQLANAGELLRYTYPGWGVAEVDRFQGMLLNIFYPLSREFLDTHAGSRVDHHFANWDAAQMVTIISVGVFADDREKYDEAIDYFFNGEGNGSITRAVFDGETGQLQESGRDQAHAQLGIGLLAAMCQTAFNQGDDLFAYDDNRLLKGFEYTAQYLLGFEVPFTTYSDESRTHTEISPLQREQRRPIYEMIYHHYAVRQGVPTPYTQQLAGEIRPEGYHGDHPGFGTLLFTRAGD